MAVVGNHQVAAGASPCGVPYRIILQVADPDPDSFEG